MLFNLLTDMFVCSVNEYSHTVSSELLQADDRFNLSLFISSQLAAAAYPRAAVDFSPTAVRQVVREQVNWETNMSVRGCLSTSGHVLTKLQNWLQHHCKKGPAYTSWKGLLLPM